MDLLNTLGYERNHRNELVYFRESDTEILERQKQAMDELKRLTDSLKRMKSGDLRELEEFLSARSETRRTTLSDRFRETFERHQISPRQRPDDDESPDENRFCEFVDRYKRKDLTFALFSDTPRSSSRSSLGRTDRPRLPSEAEIRDANDKTLRLVGAESKTRCFDSDSFQTSISRRNK